MSIVHPYFCTECKKELQHLDQLLFVEEGSNRGFCSEDCILDFYQIYVNYYKKKLQDEIQRLGLDESILIKKDDDDLVEELSRGPSEIYCLSNELNEEVYFYIKKVGKITSVMTCSVFNQTPAFIFNIFHTENIDLINSYRIGEKREMQLRQNEEVSTVEAELIQSLENKKSQLLSEVIIERKDSDIPIEFFSEFDEFISETMDLPDEVYSMTDIEGDKIFYFLRSFSNPKFKNFYYIVISLELKTDETVTYIPILSFPTNDIFVYQNYRRGSRHRLSH